MTEHEKYLSEAFKEAFHAIRSGLGGPFGAVVVRDGMIIGKGSNRVISENDPTAHAEVTAIRAACRSIGNFDLSGTVIYSTCEPCPMCLSAIYWAKIDKIYYCHSQLDARDMGFSDHHIYLEIALSPAERIIPMEEIEHPSGKELIGEWKRDPQRKLY